MRTLGDSVLVQNVDDLLAGEEWRVVTTRQPATKSGNLVLAWRVCGRTTSNAIVVAPTAAVGVGAGQQSRVVAANIADQKAGERAKGGAAATTPSSRSPTSCESSPTRRHRRRPAGRLGNHDEIDAAADEIGLAMVNRRTALPALMTALLLDGEGGRPSDQINGRRRIARVA